MAAVFIDFTKVYHLTYLSHQEATFSRHRQYLSKLVQGLPLTETEKGGDQWSCIRLVDSDKRGVPQGSLLGPLLFSIYVNDMPSVVRSAVLNMYVDDTTVYTTGKCPTHVAQCLTNEFEHLSSWCQANHLRINPAKTTAMILCRGGLQRDVEAPRYTCRWRINQTSTTLV